MEFRTAAIDDLPVIADIFLRCWTISYKSVLSESARESFSPDSAAELWRKSIELPGDKETVLLIDGEKAVAVTRMIPLEATCSPYMWIQTLPDVALAKAL